MTLPSWITRALTGLDIIEGQIITAIRRGSTSEASA
jgi:hypothetical protein